MRLSTLQLLESTAYQDGFYWLTGFRLIPADSGHGAALLLEDSTGSAMVTHHSLSALKTSIPMSGPVKARLSSEPAPRNGNTSSLKLLAIRPAVVEEIQNVAALLPRRLTPIGSQSSLNALVRFADELLIPTHRHFLNRILLDPAVGLSVLSARGSRWHHHCAPGGLLTHTMEVMQVAEALAARKLPHQPYQAVRCQLGSFLHDIGKVLTHPAITAACSRAMPHHTHTTRQIVEPHLNWLSRHDPELASELCAVVKLGSTPMVQSRRAVSVVAEIVSLADQFSAMSLTEGARRYLYAPLPANDAAPAPVRQHFHR